VARFGRKRDDEGSGWVPEWEDQEGSEQPYSDDSPEEGRYAAERVEEEIYDQREQGVEVVAEGAGDEPPPGGLTEQAAREAEARADARAAEHGRAPAREDGEGPHVATDGATLGRDFVIPGVDSEDNDPYRWHTGAKRDHGGQDAIEIIDLVKQFGRTRILNGLNLGLPDNQISMVLEVRKKFGLLFQDGALFGSMNIYDNVAFPLRQHTDKGEDEIGEIVNRRLKEVGLSEALYHMPNELSGGMRKRAGFARALVLDPAIVMFDEPDSGLDPVRTALLCELIREVHEENGGCYLVISHDLGTARRIADFIAVLWKGKIVESGPKEELFNSENEFVSQFLNAEVTGPLAMD
jgi:phospholipid/cholesterol/gamma-HCH transport system ATP-binding protein